MTRRQAAILMSYDATPNITGKNTPHGGFTTVAREIAESKIDPSAMTTSHLRLQIDLNEQSYQQILKKMAQQEIKAKPKNLIVKEFFVRLI